VILRASTVGGNLLQRGLLLIDRLPVRRVEHDKWHIFRDGLCNVLNAPKRRTLKGEERGVKSVDLDQALPIVDERPLMRLGRYARVACPGLLPSELPHH
jgi:hypothetical protein